LNLVSYNYLRNWLRDISDLSYPPYQKTLHVDPKNSDGIKYVYKSNIKRFQLYAYLESETDVEKKDAIANLNIECGIKICNYGKATGKTPLDKSLQEYENELAEEERLKNEQ